MSERDDAQDEPDGPAGLDERLAELLADAAAEHDPRVLALPPPLRARFAELQRLQLDLDATAARERELLAQVDGTSGDAAAAAPAPSEATPWLRLSVIAAVAAGLLLIVHFMQSPPVDSDPLGGGHAGTLGATAEVVLRTPIGEVDDFDRFEWNGTLPPMGRFVLTIRDAAAPATAAPMVERRLDGTSWSRDATAPPLPDRITWRVDVAPLEGPLQRGAEASAWLRP